MVNANTRTHARTHTNEREKENNRKPPSRYPVVACVCVCVCSAKKDSCYSVIYFPVPLVFAPDGRVGFGHGPPKKKQGNRRDRSGGEGICNRHRAFDVVCAFYFHL